MPINPIIRDNLNATKLMQYCDKHKHDLCKVLDKEEELALIESLKDDPAKLQEALIMHNVAMAFNMATKFMSATRSFDETVQYCLYGLCYAAKKFDYTQTKTKFSTYAYNWVYKYAWWTYYKDTQDTKDPMSSAISLDSSISDFASSSKSADSDAGDLGNFLESHLSPDQSTSIPAIETQLEHNSMSNIYEAMREYMLTSDFTDTDRIVFDGAFVNNLSNRKISSDFNIPLNEVKESYSKILGLMKTKLSTQNINSMEDVY